MRIYRLAYLIAGLFFLACGETEYSDIPSLRVYLELDLNYEDKDLNSTGANKIFTHNNINASREYAGFGGVIVYNSPFGGFRAYDIACPHERQKNITVKADGLSETVVCPQCGSKYSLETGHPIEGPSSDNPKGKFLRLYNTTPVSGGKFTVQN